MDESAVERNFVDAPNFLTSELPNFRLFQGANKFSPYAVKAGTAQGEEEGEGNFMSISSQKSVRISAFRPDTHRIFGLEPLVCHLQGFRVVRALVLADPLEIKRFCR